MLTIFLIFLIIFLACVCIILSILAIEALKAAGHRPLRRWRIAWSKRQQINDALLEKNIAIAEAHKAINHTERVTRESERLVRMANDRVATMGSYIIAEQCAEHIKAIKADNYHAKEKKIFRSMEVARENGYRLPEDEQKQLTRMLKQAHEKAQRIAKEKQKQAEIKEQIREEEQAQREIQKEIKRAEEARKQKEHEAKIKQKALEEAIALLGDTHSEQIEEMKLKLAEAEAEAEEARLAAERTQSMAQQTKRGHIYIISNIGSFGQNVYKVGMTRRLEPFDRVRELGDASVPFGFDVHAMISSDDAPSLETNLHHKLESYRVNRVNLRKEFFRVDLDTIIDVVKQEHGEIDYEADAEALEYLESVAIAQDQRSAESRILIKANNLEEDE